MGIGYMAELDDFETMYAGLTQADREKFSASLDDLGNNTIEYDGFSSESPDNKDEDVNKPSEDNKPSELSEYDKLLFTAISEAIEFGRTTNTTTGIEIIYKELHEKVMFIKDQLNSLPITTGYNMNELQKAFFDSITSHIPSRKPDQFYARRHTDGIITREFGTETPSITGAFQDKTKLIELLSQIVSLPRHLDIHNMKTLASSEQTVYVDKYLTYYNSLLYWLKFIDNILTPSNHQPVKPPIYKKQQPSSKKQQPLSKKQKKGGKSRRRHRKTKRKPYSRRRR
jgi:hypothetical protein